MRIWLEKVILLLVCFCVVPAAAYAQQAPALGALYEFGALASSGITNTGNTIVQAKAGVSHGSLSGFPPGVAVQGTHEKDALTRTAVDDARAAMANLAGQANTNTIASGDLTGITITPGVHVINSGALLNGKLTFDGQNKTRPVFIIKVKGALEIQRAEYELLNNAASINIYWLIDGDVAVRKGTAAWGNIFSYGNILMEDGAQVQGRLVAPSVGNKGNISFTNNALNYPADLAVVLSKEPGSKGEDTYAFGEQITYHITVQNNGPTNAENVTVAGANLAGQVVSYTSSRPGVTLSNSNWYIGNLNYNDVVTITVVAKTDRAGFLSSLVSVSGSGVDEALRNNSSGVTFCVLLSETGEITGATEVCKGDVITYSITPVEGATSYAWTAPSGWIVRPLGSPGVSTSVEVTVGSERVEGGVGKITVTASNTCGTGPPRVLEVVMQMEAPAQPGPITGPDAICRGAGNLTYSIDPVPNATLYLWTLPKGWSFVSGEGTTEIVVDPGDNSGEITVVAANACGDSAPQTKYVQVDDASPAAPSEITGTIQGCVGEIIPYEVPEVPTATTYQWTVPNTGGWEIVSGNGTRKIMVKVGSTAGNITVRAGNGCGVSDPISKYVEPVSSPSPAPGQIAGDVYTCFNQNGLVYSVEPVPTATSYLWKVPEGWSIESGQGTTKIVVNAKQNGGNITVVAINDCGTSEESILKVIPAEQVPLQPGPITGGQYGCVSSTATYSIEEITGVNSYFWTVPTTGGWEILSGQGTTSIEVKVGSTSGQVKVAGINGCGAGAVSALDVVPQTSPPAPPMPISGPTEVCQDGVGYVYSVTPVAGVNVYEWNVPSDWTITSGRGTASITVTAGKMAGVVTVNGENDCGKGADASMEVTVIPSPPEQPGEITGPPSVCVDQRNVTYSIEPVAFASSYVWSVGDKVNGWEIMSGQGSTSIVVNAGSAPTVISVKAVNACGVTGETQLTTIMTTTVPAMPGPISGTTVPCIGGTYTFSIDAVAEAYKYNWYFPQGWKVVEDNGTSVTVETNGTGGTVRVTAENGCGPGAEQTLQVTPSDTPPVAPQAILGNVDACAGKEATFSVEEVNGATEYFWNLPQGWTVKTGQGTTSVVVLVGNAGGAITVTTKNSCGDGGSVSREIQLNTAPPATPGPIKGSPQVCTSSAVTFSIDPVNNATSYFWNVPAGWEIMAGQGTTSIEVKVGTATGNVGNVTVKAINSCGDSGVTSLAVAASDDTSIVPGAITGPEGSFCQGTEGLVYSISPVVGAVSYDWEVPQGWVIESGEGTTSIKVTAGATAGKVTVTAVNACGNGGTASLDVMAQTTPLTPQITLGPVNPCQGVTTTYSVSASVSGNVDTYLWEVPKGWVIVSGENTSTIEVIANGTAGKIKVTAKNSCQTSGTAEMDVTPSAGAPAEPGAIVGGAGLCAGSTVTYTIEHPAKGVDYKWEVPEGWGILSGQGTATVTVVAGEGTGLISVTGQNGCGTTSAAKLDVAAMPAEGATAIKDSSSPCVGLSYEVEPVPGATEYDWTVPPGWSITSGQGTPKITVTPGFGNGSITVTVGNGGCTDAPVSIIPDPTMANSELHFPNVFSPNSDGNNDVWVVRNLSNYADNEVTIINRWGNQVYHSKSYKNNWTGDNLSEGTYFYVVRVKLCDGQDKMFKGYVMIVR